MIGIFARYLLTEKRTDPLQNNIGENYKKRAISNENFGLVTFYYLYPFE